MKNDDFITRFTCTCCDVRIRYDKWKDVDATKEYVKCPLCGCRRNIQLMRTNDKNELFPSGNETRIIDIDNFKTYPYELLIYVNSFMKSLLGDAKPPFNFICHIVNSLIENIDSELETRKPECENINDDKVFIIEARPLIVCELLLFSKTVDHGKEI